MKVNKADHNVIAGSGAFFNSLCEDLSDFRWVLVDALGFAIDEYDQNRSLSVFCWREASASS